MPLPTDPLVDFADALTAAIVAAYAAHEIGATQAIPTVTWPWALTCQRSYVPVKPTEQMTGLYVFVTPPRRTREREGRVWGFKPQLSIVVQAKLAVDATLTGDNRKAALKTETDKLMAFATCLEDWIGQADRVPYKSAQEMDQDVAYFPADLDQAETFVRVTRITFFDGVRLR